MKANKVCMSLAHHCSEARQDNSPGIQVCKLAPAERERWDAFVESSEQGTAFHKRLWFDLADVPAETIACMRDGQILAGMAFVRGRSLAFTQVGQRR